MAYFKKYVFIILSGQQNKDSFSVKGKKRVFGLFNFASLSDLTEPLMSSFFKPSSSCDVGFVFSGRGPHEAGRLYYIRRQNTKDHRSAGELSLFETSFPRSLDKSPAFRL